MSEHSTDCGGAEEGCRKKCGERRAPGGQVRDPDQAGLLNQIREFGLKPNHSWSPRGDLEMRGGSADFYFKRW